MPRSNMRAPRLAPLFALLPLLVVRSGSGASLPANTWPERLSKEDVACLELLRPADEPPTSRTDFRLRYELIRAAWPACSGPEVDPRFFSRATRLQLTLPELTDDADRLAMLVEARRRLESLPFPSPELVYVIDEFAGRADVAGRDDEAREIYAANLERRRAVYGELSHGVTEGMIYIAYSHATETGDPDFRMLQARRWAEEAVQRFKGCTTCLPQLLDAIMSYRGVLDALELKEAGEEFSTLFYDLYESTPGTHAHRKRWDEPLPEASAQE
jgi:hypothetical protein